MLAGILALPQRAREDTQSRYFSGRATPGPATRSDQTRARNGLPVGGEAPWALSALPGCFHQIRFASGDAAFVRAKLPASARAVPTGATLATANCRVRIGPGDAYVTRGADAFHIPPPARLFVAGERLLLETRAGARSTLRTYALARGGPPRFERR